MQKNLYMLVHLILITSLYNRFTELSLSNLPNMTWKLMVGLQIESMFSGSKVHVLLKHGTLLSSSFTERCSSPFLSWICSSILLPTPPSRGSIIELVDQNPKHLLKHWISGLGVLKAGEQWDFLPSRLLWSSVRERASFISLWKEVSCLPSAFSWGVLWAEWFVKDNALLGLAPPYPFPQVLANMFLSHYKCKWHPEVGEGKENKI